MKIYDMITKEQEITMIIKYCPNCHGAPYTEDVGMASCPICGSNLEIASVSDEEVSTRKEFSELNPTETFSTFESTTSSGNVGFHPQTSGFQKPNGTICITGRVSEYTKVDATQGYRRLFFQKWQQALGYGQRMEDVLHSFSVTDDDGQGYVVNVHGSTNVGAQLHDNATVQVRGKMTSDNVLMATHIDVMNGGIVTPVRFQRSVRGTFTVILLLLSLVMSVVVAAKKGTGFMSALESIYATAAITFLVLLVIYLAALFSRMGLILVMFSGRKEKRGSPFGTMLVMSLIISLLIHMA